MVRIYLLGIAGPLSGHAFAADVGEDTWVRVGRGEGTGISAPELDPHMCRDHAVITLRAGALWVTHTGGVNYTYVDKAQLDSRSPDAVARSGSEITLGHSTFRLVIGGTDDGGDIGSLKRYARAPWSPPRLGAVFAGRGNLLAIGLSLAVVLLLALTLVLPGIQYLSRAASKPAGLSLNPLLTRDGAGAPLTGLSREAPAAEYSYSPALLWLPGRARCAVVVADPEGRLSALDGGTLEPLWTAVTEPLAVGQGPAIGDITGSGADAIVLCTRAGTAVAVNPGDGLIIWESDFLAADLLSPSIGDLDGDGANDIVVLSCTGSVFVGRFRAGQMQFEHLRRLAGPFVSPPAVANIDGDRGAEIVAVNRDGRASIIDGTGGEITVSDYFPLGSLAAASGGASFDRIDVFVPPALVGDSAGRLVLVGRDPNAPLVFALSAMGGALDFGWARNLNALVPRPNQTPPQRYAAPVALGDVTGDGQVDVAVATVSGTLLAFDGATGETVWSYNGSGDGGMFVASPALFDVDKDGTLDVILADSRGAIHVVSARNGAALGVNAGSTPVVAPPVVGDIDGDFRVDIVVQDSSGAVHAIGTNCIVADRGAFWPTANGTPGRTNTVKPAGHGRREWMGRILLVIIIAAALLLANAVLAFLLWKRSRTLRSRLQESLKKAVFDLGRVQA